MMGPTDPGAVDPAGPRPNPARGGRRVGDILIDHGHLSTEQLDQALQTQKQSGQLIGELLVEQGMISANTLVQALAESLGLPGVQLRHGLIDPKASALVSTEECERLGVLPMFLVRGTLTVAMTDPRNLPVIDRMADLTGHSIRPVLALSNNIREFLGKYRDGDHSVDAFLTSLETSDVEVMDGEAIDEGPTTEIDRMIEGSPIVNLVNVALLTAVKDGASDIHIEPNRNGTRIRYRIDGHLRDLMKPPHGMHAAIASRVKIIGKMDIAEKRMPQEGRVRIKAEGRDIDLRVSSIPTLLGEKLVLRILDNKNLRIRLDELGFRIDALQVFTRVLKQPHGLILVTGPTGSGKTTTLYSALDLLRSPELNVVTVEDPVEYQLDLVNQIQVNEGIGMSFARALRSILRQDPDVIMVGEIRDEETARVAVQAALTGHSVLATLHTNDAPGAVARLQDMNIESYLISSALNGVVAQRLIRTLCPHCETKYFPSEDVLFDAELTEHSGRSFRKGEGCKKCHDTGFKGRMGVYEVMEVSPEVRRLIYNGAPAAAIRSRLKDNGMLSLRDEGIIFALQGQTSLEEVLRVTQSNDVDDPTADGPELRGAA